MPPPKRCCNPLLKEKHNRVSRGLRLIGENYGDKYKNLIGKYLCGPCRIELYKNKLVEAKKESDSVDVSETYEECESEDDMSCSSGEDLEDENFFVSRMEANQLHSEDIESDNKIMAEMQTALSKVTNRQEKMRMLTSAPVEWSAVKIQRKLGVTRYMAETALKLRRTIGFGSVPKKKGGHSLSTDIVEKVKQFYELDECSRVMPGKKDCITVNRNGIKQRVQKRLLLSNIKELHSTFLTKNENFKISLAAFRKLRPQHCVVVGCSGSHNVCVCKIHQNLKLKIQGVNDALKVVGSSESFLIDDMVKKSLCPIVNESCYLLNCKCCPGFEQNITNEVKTLLQHSIIHYKQWTCTDRCELVDKDQSISSFLGELKRQIPLYAKHDFISKSQSEFFSITKEGLKNGEFLVTLDFAENYSFKVQDAIQSYHWSNDQATLHPYVIYYKLGDKIVSECFVIISEYTKHDATSVHLFNKKMIAYLKQNFSCNNVEKLIFFSDGCAAQYKNKSNFSNLLHHNTDFGIKSEWHFFATSHGKGACDGVGGTVKRLASRASLQRPNYDQITTPRKLYEWASTYFDNIAFDFCSLKEHEHEERTLCNRFKQALAIAGTRSYHSFIPIDAHNIACREISASTEYDMHRVL